MKVALIGAEIEENLGLRYMASSLEAKGHQAEIIPFNDERDIQAVVDTLKIVKPDIAGLSMVFTSRAREFCKLAKAVRQNGFSGHITAGGHFAALNCIELMSDFPEFDSVAVGEGEELICNLAGAYPRHAGIPGFCLRYPDGTIQITPSGGNPDNLDSLPFPRRDKFYDYFGKPIASILSSRGCWRNCAFCSINAWYKSGGGKKFRTRSVGNIVKEMKELYVNHGVRIFNFQDDNFFLPDEEQNLKRFTELRNSLWTQGIKDIAIAVKARPDSINREAIRVLDDLGLFRVFLGVENISENGLKNLNRMCSREQIENALKILNSFDIHIAYNLLMFEPDTNMFDLLENIRFIESHMDNPFNFCRAEAYAGTGLEKKLRNDEILTGDYFGFDYRIKDLSVEVFHRIANYAFFDRNFSDFGLHYFNMEVDFSFNLLRRFYPETLTQKLRGEVRSFIKQTNIDTYRHLCSIYDAASDIDPMDQESIKSVMIDMRQRVDEASASLRLYGEAVLGRVKDVYAGNCISMQQPGDDSFKIDNFLKFYNLKNHSESKGRPFGFLDTPVPYDEFFSELDSAIYSGEK